jgi:predicted DNA binding CopG/RHH family protein
MKPKKRLPEFQTLEDFAAFWEDESALEYEELEDVVEESRTKRVRLKISLPQSIARRVRQRAKSQGLAVDELLERYIRKQLLQESREGVEQRLSVVKKN